MTKSTKHIHLIGIERKEAMLVKSFVDLVNDDLNVDYQIDSQHQQVPSLFIVDELSHHDDVNAVNPKAPMLVVGEDANNPEIGYLHRPMQWSRFKSVLELLSKNENNTIGPDLTQVIEVDGEIEDRHGAKSFRSETVAIASKVDVDTKTNKEKVASISSIETPRAELLDDHSETTQFEISSKDVDLANQYEGLDRLGANIKFWDDSNCQVIVAGKPVFFVLPEREMVYSEYMIHDWESLLRSKDARTAFMPDDWQPTGKMKSYPIRWLTWFSGHARSKGYLLTDLNKDHFFLLNKWPEFDLLYSNNEHLKLCGLMFKEGHSIQEMVSKTHLRARVIIGLINACYKLGVLSSFPDKDSARPKINQSGVDTHTVMSLLSKVFKTT